MKEKGFSDFIDRNLMRLLGAFVALWQVIYMLLMYLVLVTDEEDLSVLRDNWEQFAEMASLAVLALVVGELVTRWEKKRG